MTAAPHQKLLLLELLTTDPVCQMRSDLYPYIQAYARSRGVPTVWVALPFDLRAQPRHPRLVALSPEDIARLAAAARAHQATRIFVNEELDEATRQALGAPVPREIDASSERLTAAEVDAWLDLKAADGDPYLVDRVAPSYDCRPLGDLPMRPWVQVVGGPRCLYDRPVTASRFYNDLDIAPAHGRVFGCTYCALTREELGTSYRSDPIAVALAQIIAVAGGERSPRHPRRFDVRSALVWPRSEDFFGRILDAGLPPCELAFSIKADVLLGVAPALERLLPRLHAAGHSLHFPDMGIENFSPTENERLNKDVGEAEVRRLFDLLAAWESAWPGAARFHQYNGFGFILFTPWTTLADLEENARAFRRLDQLDLNYALTTRLILLPERPITLLAARDGWTRPAFADPAAVWSCEAAHITQRHAPEIPWAFAHPVVGAIYGLLVRRAAPPGRAAGDELAAVVRTLAAAFDGDARPPLAFFDALLAAAAAHPEVTTSAGLLEVVPRPASPLKPSRAGSAPSAAAGPLAELVRRLDRHPRRPLAPFVVLDLAPADAGCRIELADGEDRLTLYLLPRADCPEAIAGTADWAISHAPATPVNTPAKRRVLRVLTAFLNRPARPA